MKKILILAALILPEIMFAKNTSTLASPDGKLTATVTAGSSVKYSIALDGRTVMCPSEISMTLDDGTVWGPGSKVIRIRKKSEDAVHDSPFYRSAQVRDRYNSMTLEFKGGWNIEFRVYNDGVAYRFSSTGEEPFKIIDEQAEFVFPDDFSVTLPYVSKTGSFEEQLFNSFENTYSKARISEIDTARLAFLPVLADAGNGAKICLTEVNLENYPGMYLRSTGDRLRGYFARYPESQVQGGHNNLQMIVTGRKDYIAEVNGPRTFPWRVAIVARSDREIAASDLGYILAEPSRINDISWIRPGKVAWEWWNDMNLDGVDFVTGINDRTYQAYIDFASENGIEYIILDEGWAVHGLADLMQVVPEIHLPELVRYAQERNVGIILWAGYKAFNKDMENVCRHYSEMGIKGFKVDFMDRDDQEMTAFNYRAAETAAKYHLILDLHGTHKPAGLNRTWPNVLNFEGVFGLEQMKWTADVDQMEYDTCIPFIRQVSGPLDYTQGAMRNAARGNFYPCNSEPMSQGTRCHQLALYIIFDSPLTMLCDSPSNYMREPECTGFIASVPVYWDETRILAGEAGEYIVTARRKGDVWYVGGITDWNARDLEVDLSFISEGTFQADIFRDGINADRAGRDYVLEQKNLDSSEPFRVHLAPGGGFTMKIQKM